MSVFPHPVRVKHFHVRVFPADALFSDPLYTLPHGFSSNSHVCSTTSTHVPGCPAASTTYLCPDYDDTLFCLVSKCTGAVDPCWSVNTDNTSFTAPNLHPFPKEGFDSGLCRDLPCVPDICIHRFCHAVHQVQPEFQATFLTGRIPKVHYKSIRQNIYLPLMPVRKIPG